MTIICNSFVKRKKLDSFIYHSNTRGRNKNTALAVVKSCAIRVGAKYLDIPIIYVYIALQRESTHFGLRIPTDFGLEVSTQVWPNNHTRKSDNIYRSFYLLFSYNFLSKTMSIFPLFILLTRRID